MWRLWQKATKYGKQPSKLLPGVECEWTAYMLDNAVTFFGITIENALLETEDVGSGKHKRSLPKYKLDQLLDPEFRLPRPQTELQKRRQAVSNLLMLTQDPGSGVKLWREVAPGGNGTA